MSFSPNGLIADATAWTASDTKEAPNNMIGIYVGGAGNLAVQTHAGRSVTFNSVPAGTFIPIKVRNVRATSTTATNIVLLLGQGK